MATARLRWVVLTLVVLAVIPGLGATADASYEGTPGRVAYNGTVELTSGSGTGPIVTVDGVPVAPNVAPPDDQVPPGDPTPVPAPPVAIAPPGTGPGAMPAAAAR